MYQNQNRSKGGANTQSEARLRSITGTSLDRVAVLAEVKTQIKSIEIKDFDANFKLRIAINSNVSSGNGKTYWSLVPVDPKDYSIQFKEINLTGVSTNNAAYMIKQVLTELAKRKVFSAAQIHFDEKSKNITLSFYPTEQRNGDKVAAYSPISLSMKQGWRDVLADKLKVGPVMR